MTTINGRRNSNWLQRYAALLKFIDAFQRFPDRHFPKSTMESSLAWWLKDQRRKMRYGVRNRRKRGVLNRAQKRLLREIDVRPDYNIGFRPPPLRVSGGKSARA